MSKKCKNCGEELCGDYCYRCGQKASTGRLTMRYFYHELAYSFTHADRRGIFFTLKALFTRPGYMLRDYILGRRANYFRPFPLLIILATLYGIADHLVEKKWDLATAPAIAETQDNLSAEHTAAETANYAEAHYSESLSDILKGYRDAIREHREDMAAAIGKGAETLSDEARGDTPPKWGEKSIWWGTMTDLGKWTIDHLVIFSVLLFLPFFALGMKKAFRRVGIARYNYAECLYVSAYMFCQWLILLLLLLPLDFIRRNESGYWALAAFFVLSVWTFKQFFGIGIRCAFRRTVWMGVILWMMMTATALLLATVIVFLTFLLTGQL